MKKKKHVISRVFPGSIGEELELEPGDILAEINHQPVEDVFDYRYLLNDEYIELLIEKANGELWELEVEKDYDEDLGIEFENGLMDEYRSCRNKCIFCFIDQMPPGMRPSLYVKDDDWRLSMMMGNYVTLTNVDEQEFQRIIRRKASPLYISVHTTNPELRVRMMHNKNARFIMDRLHRLADAGLHFHCQIVLCPGYNDGDELRRTLTDLSALYPAAQSAALVPVGLTKFREGLDHVVPFNRETAGAVMQIAHEFQEELLQEIGTRFVFPSDEMVLISGEQMPSPEEYEGFPQIENGVGLLCRFEESLRQAAEESAGLPAVPRKVRIPCGTSIAPVMRRWVDTYGPKEVQVAVQPIRNTFFGETVTVTGLITGGDLKTQLADAPEQEILLCGNTLRSEGDLFLDDMPLDELRAVLAPRKLTIVPNTGAALLSALRGSP